MLHSSDSMFFKPVWKTISTHEWESKIEPCVTTTMHPRFHSHTGTALGNREHLTSAAREVVAVKRRTAWKREFGAKLAEKETEYRVVVGTNSWKFF